METRPVIGLPVAVTDYAGAAQWCQARARAGDRAYAVSAANTHLLSHARHNEDFGKTMGRFDLICPDGMPLIWSLNAQLPPDQKLKDRVYGPTLMLEVFRETEGKSGHSHFLLGGKQSTLGQLTDRFSRNEIAGSYSPPFEEWTADENEKIIKLIQHSGAKYVWVGLGCPKQEIWLACHLNSLPPAVYFGIGAAFAFHAGEVKQAPGFIQKTGMEWLFRLCAEPRRLWKRYAVHNSLFLFYTVKDHVTN
jgi:N-acetylglucosaminyldiphosphoundecaprenol N-acetyl-beta-D-mannosaminyltransferase|tara:strand:- start:11804 stop:12550 length:747 start_codon:yes stop_codon:yes gene_type:complete